MSSTELAIREHRVSTRDGWSLDLRRTWHPARRDPSRRPLLVVPGYGMNSFIFSFHPRGTSLVRCLADAGHEVWTMDLRGQGASHADRRQPGPVGMEAYSRIDLPTAVERVLDQSGRDRLTLVGCSLGGSIAYGYLALVPDAPVAGLVAMGAPLRWDEAHPLMRLAFASPRLASVVKMSNTRKLMRTIFPLFRKMPQLVSFYMNLGTIDADHFDTMSQTVEDPASAVNRDIAVWLGKRDLWLDGVNVTEALGRVRMPLLLVVPNKDGIVPVATAKSAAKAWGGPVEVIDVGDDRNWYAHANMFIAHDCSELVFGPVIRWLEKLDGVTPS
jgi:pimeloyl-ACP methyl ester carboxylesterase